MSSPLFVQNLTLRPAIAEDVGWAAPLLFAAGPAIFSYLFASPSEESRQILQQAFTYPQHAFSYEYTQVVEVQGQPAGLMIGYPGDRKRQAEEKVHFVMARIMSLRKLPRILVNVADFNRIKQAVDPNDYYILSMSVLPEFRSQGIGSYLLQQADLVASSEGCASLCLDVTYKNHRARALFERQGFQVTCSKTTTRFDQLTRSGGLHRMSREL